MKNFKEIVMNVGFIGIGQMGRHMAKHILEAGYNLTVYDINEEAAAHLLARGAKWGSNPRELAESCQVVITCLPTPQIIEETVYGPDGLKSGWKKGDIYIDMSTNSPSTIRRIAEDAEAMGVEVLDAPVSGGTRGAEMGALTIMVGGDVATLEKVRKVLETMGQKIFPVGTVGCGNAAKLVNNMIALACSSVDAEGFALGVKAGLDPEVLWDIISASTGNNWSLQQYPNSVFKDNFEPGFKVSLAAKDIGLAIDLAREYNMALPLGTAAQKNLHDLMDAGFADKDVAAIIKLTEEKTGVKISLSD
jgi:2-hydroxymethylglutarate dehydrogenase